MCLSNNRNVLVASDLLFCSVIIDCKSILQDVVIVNKIDSLGKVDEGSIAQRISDLENEIHQINSLAKIVRTEHCRVNWREILECRAYDREVKLHIPQLYSYLLSLRKTHNMKT